MMLYKATFIMFYKVKCIQVLVYRRDVKHESIVLRSLLVTASLTFGSEISPNKFIALHFM